MSPAREDCLFFHVIDLPGEESANGAWDFRKTEAQYHGSYPLAGKTVLEVGSATGCHAFWMERQGAHVTPMDLSPDHDWDLLLTSDQDPSEVQSSIREIKQGINNGWHYCRDRLGSDLELRFGSLYDIPEELGDFDVVTYGSVLLHVRDPLGALQHGAKRAREALIIMDRLAPDLDPQKPLMQFMPRKGKEFKSGNWTWYWFSPQTFINFLEILGFRDFDVQTSSHRFVPMGENIELFTLIARR